MADIYKVLDLYGMKASVSEYGDGHINDTYVFDYDDQKYILQRINHEIFKNPGDVMNNILYITEHISKKLINRGINPDRKTLTVVLTKDNKPFCEVDGLYYRIYKFVDNTITYQTVEKPELFYSAAKGFGEFYNLLSDFDAHLLKETIPNFHDTYKRLNNLKNSVSKDVVGRTKDVQKEIDFILERAEKTSVIINEIEKGTVPLRVTHNDTKLNNILFDKETKEALCVIDLDTVMPGSILFDYGDAIRFGANPVAEDEKDLSKVYCDMEKFEAITKGFLEIMGKTLTDKEIELLPFSAQILTLESGIRFLTDYLDGDVYFKIHYPEQNLYRARNQLKLVYDMEQKEEEMHTIIKKYI